ncbi:MAG: pirin family protein [Verrucomicrobia bacterium]|nr:pirin family protein [Verrucomicrobiota bacterium]
MFDVRRANTRHFSDYGWLQTYWLFSFADYVDPDNTQFGALRVFNDDVIGAGQGFSAHPHRNMEIISVVHRGTVTHQDSMGTQGDVKAGDVQCMSAGTGVVHSEFNLAEDPLELYQIWIEPREQQRPPSYDQRSFSPSQWQNRLCPLASGEPGVDAARIHADATIYRAGLEAGHTLTVAGRPGRGLFIYVTTGDVEVNGTALQAKDQARIRDEQSLRIATDTIGDIMVVDVPL